MHGVEFMALAAERVREMFNYCRANFCHSNRAAAFCEQATGRCAVIAARLPGGRVDEALPGMLGVHVDKRTVRGRTIINRHASRDQQAATSPDRSRFAACYGSNAQRFNGSSQTVMKMPHEFLSRPATPIQRSDGVDRQLPGTMQDDSTATVDPPHRNFGTIQLLLSQPDMGSRPIASHRDHWRVLTADNDQTVSHVSSGLVRQSSLERFPGAKIQPAQQKELGNTFVRIWRLAL